MNARLTLMIITILFALNIVVIGLGNAANDTKIWLTATGDLRGEIKPCGCSPDGDMGGLLRRATYLDKVRATQASVLYVDLGNNFPEPSEQGHLKTEVIQQAFKKLQPQVILLGPNELRYGIATLDQALPYLVTNVSVDWSIQKTHQTSLSDQRIVIWGYLSPTQIYQNKNEAPVVLPVGEELLLQWKEQLQTESADYTILLFRGNEEELARFEKAEIFDLILTGSNNDDELNQVLEMKTSTNVFPAIPTKGQGALEGVLEKGSQTTQLEVEWLLDRYEDHPSLKQSFKDYDEAVKALFFSNLDRMEKHQQDSPYAGNETCKTCHIQQHQIWSDSRHSHAFDTLKKEDKHFDLECLQCHVVGLNQQGFLSPELTSNLMNVQCENCHGPSKTHASNPAQVKPANLAPQEACASCHKGSHSPLFQYSNYWPKIRH